MTSLETHKRVIVCGGRAFKENREEFARKYEAENATISNAVQLLEDIKLT